MTKQLFKMFRVRTAKTSPRPSCGPTSSTSTRKGTRRTSPSRWKAWQIKSNIKFRGSTFSFNINCYSYIKGIFYWKKLFYSFQADQKRRAEGVCQFGRRKRNYQKVVDFRVSRGWKVFIIWTFFFLDRWKIRIYLRVLVNLNLKVFACCANNVFFLVHWIINYRLFTTKL